MRGHRRPIPRTDGTSVGLPPVEDGPPPPFPTFPMTSPFLLALHCDGATPRALAVVERHADGADEPTYTVHDLRRLDGDDPTTDALAVLAAPEHVARTLVVATGGQPAADALRARGPSAVAVTLLDGRAAAGADVHTATAGELANTFARVYRAGGVAVAGGVDDAADAVRALDAAADPEASAEDRDETRDADGTVDEGTTTTLSGDTVAGDGPAPAVVRQSGGQKAVSTERVDARTDPRDLTAAAVTATDRAGRVSGASPADAPDLDDAALALGLAVWYAETTRDELPTTDKADEALNALRA